MEQQQIRNSLREVAQLYFSKKISEAFALCDQLILECEHNKLSPIDVYFVRGVLLHNQNRNEEARDSIEKAMNEAGIMQPFKDRYFEKVGNHPVLPFFSYNEVREIFDYYNVVRASLRGGIWIYYTDDLQGGGDSIGQDFKIFIHERYVSKGRRFSRVHEAFAGPGYIGFSLLGHNICDSLVLSGVNPKAVDACHYTIKKNHLENQVSVYHSDCLDAIPSNERWDLVVANPPHISVDIGKKNKITYLDENFKMHQKFFSDLGNFITPRSVVLIQESRQYSKPEDFHQMISASGLRLVGVETVAVLQDTTT